jgi:hypothetical protein
VLQEFHEIPPLIGRSHEVLPAGPKELNRAAGGLEERDGVPPLPEAWLGPADPGAPSEPSLECVSGARRIVWLGPCARP